ncbi:MAG: hypothetical protein ACYCXT_04055 [Acidiferrobacteraceae bacterium]
MEQQKQFALRISEALVAGIPPADMARALHRQESWVRQHRALVSPAAHVLFASGRLRSVSAYARLRRLPPRARRRLLDAGGLITVARCAQALPPTRVSGPQGGGAL